tara:strand:+ start:983 stop:1444 length:462 start_codon:yes stop_codon:yes gene_type:complete
MVLLGILVGILYANMLEYVIHRFLFHGFGKSRSSIFAFHLRDHHIVSKRNGFYDGRVSRNELVGMPIAILLHTPFYFLVSPAFFWTVSIYGVLFVVIHNALHRNPEFTRKYFWWHWNHHMRNQNKSWGVVLPITDILTGTLEDPRQKQRVRKK